MPIQSFRVLIKVDFKSKVGCISAKSLQVVLVPSRRLQVALVPMGSDWLTKVTPRSIPPTHCRIIYPSERQILSKKSDQRINDLSLPPLSL